MNTNNSMFDKLRIAIDFDNTITEVSEYPNMGKLKPEALQVIKELKKKYMIILWTCREGKFLEEAVNALKENGIEFDYINDCPEHTRKIIADYYIDDRAFGGIVEWNLIQKQFL